MIAVHKSTGHRPQVATEPCRVTLHLADGAEFLCMRPTKIVRGQPTEHTEHHWEAKRSGFGYGSSENVRITWSTK